MPQIVSDPTLVGGVWFFIDCFGLLSVKLSPYPPPLSEHSQKFAALRCMIMPPTVNLLALFCAVSETDLRRLHRRFQKIDVDGYVYLVRHVFYY